MIDDLIKSYSLFRDCARNIEAIQQGIQQVFDLHWGLDDGS